MIIRRKEIPFENPMRRTQSILGWIYLLVHVAVFPWLLDLLRICYHSYKVLAHAESGKAEKLKTIWRSYRDGRHFHPVTEYPD